MKAAWYDKTGPAAEVLVVGDLPDPTPAAGEVRVRIACSGINPSDVKRRAGSTQMPAAGGSQRIIPHMDGAGIIDAVGEGVDRTRIGERVWLHSTMHRRTAGTAATLAVTPSFRANPLPADSSYSIGAGLGVPAMTAHRAVFGQGGVTGRTVLVTGGAGAVGFYAIRLAKWRGARVIATVSGAAKAAEATRAGADAVVNYKTENVIERVKALTDGKGVDHIVEVDFGANLATSISVLPQSGTIASYASMTQPEPTIPFYKMMTKNLNVLWVAVYDMPRTAIDDAARDIHSWLATGKAVHPAHHAYSLDAIAQAHSAVEQHAVGKVVVTVDSNL